MNDNRYISKNHISGIKTDKLKYAFLLRVIKMLDVVLISIPFCICWSFYYVNQIKGIFYVNDNILVALIFFIVYIMLGRIYDAFSISTSKISELVYSQSLAALISDGVMLIITFLLTKNLPNIFYIIVVFLIQLFFATFWAICSNHWYFRTFLPQKTAIIYGERQGMQKVIEEYGLNVKYDVQRIESVSECLNHLDTLFGIQTVFLSGVHSHERNIIIKYCIINGINVLVIPRVGDMLMSAANPLHMFHLPILQVGRNMATPEYLFMKRTLDIMLSGIALLLTSPIFLITAIAIKLDGGPIFYKQVRLTKDGNKFNILKFRSMHIDAEKDGVARLSTGTNDDRITPIGKIIRKVRVDELPQLLLVFIGTMSIVGPRPERPEIASEYERELPEFALRLQVKAGITGYAQVYGKYNTTPYDKLQMDLMYIAHPSIIEDLKIMFATLKVLFIPESTDGVAEGQITANSRGEESVKN